MLTNFNNNWWGCSWGNLHQVIIFLSLHSKTHAWILCAIKRKKIITQLRHATNGERRNTAKWGKVACWSTKVTISLKRVKTDKKLLWRAYRNSPTLFRTVPSPTPNGLPLPKIGVRNVNPKLQCLLYQERVKLQTANLADKFTGSIRKKWQIWEKTEKGAWAYPGIATFLEYLLLSQERVKLQTSNLAGTFTGSIRTKSH